jgi:hypothetical protein
MIRLSLGLEWLDIHYQAIKPAVTSATTHLLAVHQAPPVRMTPGK